MCVCDNKKKKNLQRLIAEKRREENRSKKNERQLNSNDQVLDFIRKYKNIDGHKWQIHRNKQTMEIDMK